VGASGAFRTVSPRPRPDTLVVATTFYCSSWFLPPVSMTLAQSPSFTKPSCS
jgi:hypothetical protein